MGAFDSVYITDKGYESVLFGADKKVVELELNLLQGIQNDKRKSIITAILGNCIVGSPTFTFSGGTFTFRNAQVFFDGDIINVGQLATSAVSGNTIYLRKRSVKLAYTDNVKLDGNEQGVTINNGIFDPRINEETSMRIQTQFSLVTTASNNDYTYLTLGAIVGSNFVLSNNLPSFSTSLVASILALIDTKAPIASPTFTGTVGGVTKAHVGLGSVDNTSDANKPISTATQTALNAKAPIANPTFTGNVNAPTPSTNDNSTKVATTAYVQSASTTKMGNLSALATQAKDTLVGAINEVFQEVDNGKTALGTAILGRDSLVSVPSNPTFAQLSTAIANIGSGIVGRTQTAFTASVAVSKGKLYGYTEYCQEAPVQLSAGVTLQGVAQSSVMNREKTWGAYIDNFAGAILRVWQFNHTTGSWASGTVSANPTGTVTDMYMSGNGTVLAIKTSEAPFLQLYKREGTAFTKLTLPNVLPGGIMENVAISPDGSKVVFATRVSTGTLQYANAVHVLTISGTTVTSVTPPDTGLPDSTGLQVVTNNFVFSGNGGHLISTLVTSGTHTFKTFRVSGNTFTEITMTNPPTGTIRLTDLNTWWSSDGTKLVYLSGNDLTVVNLSSTAYTRLIATTATDANNQVTYGREFIAFSDDLTSFYTWTSEGWISAYSLNLTTGATTHKRTRQGLSTLIEGGLEKGQVARFQFVKGTTLHCYRVGNSLAKYNYRINNLEGGTPRVREWLSVGYEEKIVMPKQNLSANVAGAYEVIKSFY